MGLNFNELFPSWKCSAEEFHELFPRGTVLTVERVETRKDGRSAAGGADADQFAVCYFHELKKPISLNKTNAKVILGLAGSAELEDWDGTIVFVTAMPFEYTDDYGERRHTWVFRLYQPKPNAVVELQPKSDLTKMLAASRRKELQSTPAKPKADESGIGFEKAVSMFAYMRARNKEWPDVLAFATQNGMAKQLEARIPPELPAAARTVANLYLKHVPATKDVDIEKLREELRALWYPPEPPSKPEVFDPESGEVLSGELNPDDIPF